MSKTLIMACVLATSFVHAQKASIKRVELAGAKIIVHYDLEDSNPANEYQITLYASQSNFATALTKVKGDVGNEVKAGSNKKIEWNIIDELGPFKGRLSLEIRGMMFIPIAKINSISEGDKFKRGKSHLITWKPGNSNIINIELLKAGRPVETQLNQANNGAFSISIPKHSAVGKDYTIRITDAKNQADATSSLPFTVTRKVPLGLKLLPLLAVGGIVAVLAGGGGGGGGDDGGDSGNEIVLPELP